MLLQRLRSYADDITGWCRALLLSLDWLAVVWLLELSFVINTRLSIVRLRQCSSKKRLDLLHMSRLLSLLSCHLVVEYAFSCLSRAPDSSHASGFLHWLHILVFCYLFGLPPEEGCFAVRAKHLVLRRSRPPAQGRPEERLFLRSWPSLAGVVLSKLTS